MYAGASSEYVVSLRAFNNVGEGVPVYETTVTRDDSGTLLHCCSSESAAWIKVHGMAGTGRGKKMI